MTLFKSKIINTCEYYRGVFCRLREAVWRKRLELWSTDKLVPPSRQCSGTFLALDLDFFFAKNQTPVVCQAPYSPDMAPCDFWLFPKLKRAKFGYFSNNENPMRALNTTSLKCYLPSSDTIYRQKKFNYAYEGSKLPHASVLHWKLPGCDISTSEPTS
jgi:hypothetical protein